MVTIPDALTFIIPFLVTMLSHYLRDSGLPEYVNAIIALCSLLITAIACVWLSGSWTGDFRTLVIAVLLYVGFLARNDFKVIVDWLLNGVQSPMLPHHTNANTIPLH